MCLLLMIPYHNHLKWKENRGGGGKVCEPQQAVGKKNKIIINSISSFQS